MAARQEADDLKRKYESAISDAKFFHRPVDTLGLPGSATSSEARDVQWEYQSKVDDADRDAKRRADEEKRQADEEAKRKADDERYGR